MLEKLRNNPRIVVVALIAAGVLAIAVAAGNNKSTPQPSAPDTAMQSDQKSDENKDETAPEENKDESAPSESSEKSENSESSDSANNTNTAKPSTVAGGVANVEVSSESGNYKSTVKAGNNQTVIVRKMIADYLASKSVNLSDEQKLYVETNIVSQLPRKDRIFPGEQVMVDQGLLDKTVEASKQLTQEQIKLWSAYL